MQVLVGGDNRITAARHSHVLNAAGFQTDLLIHTHADAARRLTTTISGNNYAAVVLDYHGSGLNGSAGGAGANLVRQLRAHSHHTPLLVLSWIQSTDHMVECLQAGADVFLAQPVELPLLVAQVQALVRRAEAARGSVLNSRLAVGDLTLDPIRRIATRGTKSVRLTPRGTLLLAVLMDQPGKIFTRKELLAAVWGADYAGSPNVLNETIKLLRAEVDTGHETQLIQTVHWKGYMVKQG